MSMPRFVTWASLAAFCVLWAVVSSHDYRTQKIRHYHLAWILGIAVSGYLVLLAQSLAAGRFGAAPGMSLRFYRDAAIHAAWSAAAAVALWRLRLWPAGDAKLFAALSLLLPLATHSTGFDPGRSWLVALVNVFVPAALVVVGRAASFSWKLYLNEQRRVLLAAGWAPVAARVSALGRESWRTIRTSFDPRSWVRSPGAAAAAVLAWAGSMVFTSAVGAAASRLAPTTLLQSGICFGAMLVFSRAASGSRRAPVSIACLLIAALLVVTGGPALVGQWLPFLGSITVFSFFLSFGSRLARRLLEESGLVVAPLAAVLTWLPLGLVFALDPRWSRLLLEWAVLGALFGAGKVLLVVLEREDCPKIVPASLRPFSLLAPSFVDEMREADPGYVEEHLEPLYADGLTVEQVEAVRDWCASRRVPYVRLHTTVSFAFWIFLGYFLTVLFPLSVLRPL
jgi:hypothetical protein